MKIKYLCLVFSLACSLLPITSLGQTLRYTYSADGTEVTDATTGLVWRRCAEGQTWSGSACTGTAATYTHEAALLRAKSEASSGGKPWRLPNIKELFSITQLGVSENPSIDSTAFPNTPSNSFWSSTQYVSASNGAWNVNFSDGTVRGNNRASPRSNAYYVRLVR